MEKLEAPEYDAGSCMEPWTVIDALYFSMVTMSTVGYGDLTPSTSGSKVFTCMYIFVGITVVFVELSQALSGFLSGVETAVRHLLDRLDKTAHVSGRVLGLSGNERDISGDGKVDFIEPPSAKVYWAQGLAPWVVLQLLCQILFTWVFVALQPDLTFGDALYHCLVSATTVGYGDVSFTEQGARLLAFFHIALSVTWFAAMIGRVQELSAVRKSQLARADLLRRQMDLDLITALDRDGHGVDKLEFVIGMMIQLGVEICGQPLEWEDIKPFLAQFDAADVNNDGTLSAGDLTMMVERTSTEWEEFKKCCCKEKKRDSTHALTMRRSVGKVANSITTSSPSSHTCKKAPPQRINPEIPKEEPSDMTASVIVAPTMALWSEPGRYRHFEETEPVDKPNMKSVPFEAKEAADDDDRLMIESVDLCAFTRSEN